MAQSSKPAGLLARFNKASKALLSAAAIGFTLAAGSLPAAHAAPSAPATSGTQATPGKYEYIGNRTIRLTGAIDKASAIAVINKMLELSKQDPNADIELRINSGGGSVDDGMAIYDVMKSLPNDIRTVCEGEAQSMAAFLLSAGTPGKRFAYPNCEIMYHQPSWGANGKITDMTVVTAQGNANKNRMIEILSEETGWSKKVIRDLIERNFYPTAEEAQKMGFIDNIIQSPKATPAPAPKTKLPDHFCDNPGRQHMNICIP